MMFLGLDGHQIAIRTRCGARHHRSGKCSMENYSAWLSLLPSNWPDHGVVKLSSRSLTYMSKLTIVVRSPKRYPKDSTPSFTVARTLARNSGGTKMCRIQPFAWPPASPTTQTYTGMVSSRRVDSGPSLTPRPKCTTLSSNHGIFSDDPPLAGCFPFDHAHACGISTRPETGHVWSRPIRRSPLGHTTDGNSLVLTNTAPTARCCDLSRPSAR